MTIFKYLIIALLTFPANAVEPHVISVMRGDVSDKISSKLMDAIGAVFIIDGAKASVGTGTYIGNGKILTAGHIFRSVLPKSVPQKSGPITIDLSNKLVFWSNEANLNITIPAAATYHKASRVTVDASFINGFKASTANPDKNDVKSDIAVLTLESPVSGLREISIPNERADLPNEGLLVGYGRESTLMHKKHASAQALHGLMDMGEWAIIMANFVEDIKTNPLKESTDGKKGMKFLLGKSILESKDLNITRATQGDSGGPLLITTDKNEAHIVGIMSAKSNAFNAFASLVIKTPDGYFRSTVLDALLRASM